MISKNEILATLKEILPELQNEYSVKEIGLFGSFSNKSSEPGHESDIDILVEFEKPIGWKFFRWKYTWKRNLDEKLTS